MPLNNNPKTYGADVNNANKVDSRKNVGGFYNEVTWQDADGSTYVGSNGLGSTLPKEQTYDAANEYELKTGDGLYSWEANGPAARADKPIIEKQEGKKPGDAARTTNTATNA